MLPEVGPILAQPPADDVSVRKIEASADAAWQRRGAGRSYVSRNAEECQG